VAAPVNEGASVSRVVQNTQHLTIGRHQLAKKNRGRPEPPTGRTLRSTRTLFQLQAALEV
jgi:hypothetical protein